MMRVGVVGVGGISDIYLQNMINRYRNLEVVGCTARNMDSVRTKAQAYSIVAMTMEQMLHDPSIDLIVNLTPAPAHYQIIRQALLSGKHVYTEKVLAETYAQARELAELAESRGLRLGSAPDTFLGSSCQTAAEAVQQGLIGTVTGFNISLNRGLDLLYPRVNFLIRPGGGIGFDFGVYALTVLFSILGPAAQVCGFAQTNRPTRTYADRGLPNYGQPYTIENENIMVGSICMRSGVLGSFLFNGDSSFPEKPHLAIQGTRGTLFLPDPNQFGGEVLFIEGIKNHGDTAVPARVLPNDRPFGDNARGIGVADMAQAIADSRPHRASAEMACHILEVLEGVVSSGNSKTFSHLESTFVTPEPLLRAETF